MKKQMKCRQVKSNELVKKANENIIKLQTEVKRQYDAQWRKAVNYNFEQQILIG